MALVQSQVRCNRGSGEGLGGLVQPGQVQQGSGEEGLEKVPEKVREALSGSTGFQVWEA